MKTIQKIILTFFLFCFLSNAAQIKLCSWNLQNFGKSKSDSSIQFIAKTLKEFDLVALVEVVAGNGGAQAVARLADELNRSGNKWDYCVSDPTQSNSGGSERYAFLWKTSKIKRKGEAWLEQHFKLEIEREPYMGTFSDGKSELTLLVFHAVPKKKQPETEIKYLKFLPDKYPNLNLVFCGDFNCPQTHTVFDPLKKIGFSAALMNQKTTLKQKCANEQCLASEFDNVFFSNKHFKLLKSGAIFFYKDFPSMLAARKISDHLPVYAELESP